MIKHCILLGLATLFVAPMQAQIQLPPIAPMPVLPEPLPKGMNPTIYPVGRFDWFERVKGNIEAGKAAAATCQLVFDGDSITAGWLGPGKQVWDERYAIFHPVDFGIGGDCIEHLHWRLTQGQAEGMHPKLIVILIGINRILGYTPEQGAEGIEAVVQAYRKICPDAVVLLQAIFPRGQFPDDPLRTKVDQVNSRLALLADGKNVLFIDFGKNFLQQDGSISPDIMPDYLHPSVKGYKIWADAIQPLIDKYLGAKPSANLADDPKANASS